MDIKQEGAVTKIRVEVGQGWEQWFLLRSDAHHDSLYSRRDLEKKHLEKALERNALIIDCGDLFDAMQGRFDPRRSYDDLRPEYKGADYYNRILDDAVDFYKPYARNWLLLGRGNHETGVLKNAGIDLTSQLARELTRLGSNVVCGGYGGWIVVYTEHKSGGHRRSFKIRYYHGAGGEAPVTRGVIQTNRQAVYLPDAHVVINGHNHNEYVMTIKRERINDLGKQYFDTVYFVRIPGYKDDYSDGSGGWAIEKGMVPKPLGAAWMRMWFEERTVKIQIFSEVE